MYPIKRLKWKVAAGGALAGVAIGGFAAADRIGPQRPAVEDLNLVPNDSLASPGSEVVTTTSQAGMSTDVTLPISVDAAEGTVADSTTTVDDAAPVSAQTVSVQTVSVQTVSAQTVSVDTVSVDTVSVDSPTVDSVSVD